MLARIRFLTRTVPLAGLLLAMTGCTAQQILSSIFPTSLGSPGTSQSVAGAAGPTTEVSGTASLNGVGLAGGSLIALDEMTGQPLLLAAVSTPNALPSILLPNFSVATPAPVPSPSASAAASSAVALNPNGTFDVQLTGLSTGHVARLIAFNTVDAFSTLVAADGRQADHTSPHVSPGGTITGVLLTPTTTLIENADRPIMKIFGVLSPSARAAGVGQVLDNSVQIASDLGQYVNANSGEGITIAAKTSATDGALTPSVTLAALQGAQDLQKQQGALTAAIKTVDGIAANSSNLATGTDAPAALSPNDLAGIGATFASNSSITVGTQTLVLPSGLGFGATPGPSASPGASAAPTPSATPTVNPWSLGINL